jgi:hypothetical protein
MMLMALDEKFWRPAWDLESGPRRHGEKTWGVVRYSAWLIRGHLGRLVEGWRGASCSWLGTWRDGAKEPRQEWPAL